MKKVLYINELGDIDSTHLNHLLRLCEMGIEEIVHLSPRKIEGLTTAFSDDGRITKEIMCKGPYLHEILDAADREGASVAAVSRDRGTKGPLNDRLMKHLLNKLHLPVIVFNRIEGDSGTVPEGLFHHVVFAADWTRESKAALEYLLFNFKEGIELLEIVNVIDAKLSVRDIRHLKKKLEETRNLFLQIGIDAEAHIYAGNPSEEIILAAKDYGATCIVMGNAYKSFIRSLFTKNAPFKVARWAEVPSLFVPFLPYPDKPDGQAEKGDHTKQRF